MHLLFAKCSLISVTSSSSHRHHPLCLGHMGQGLLRGHCGCSRKHPQLGFASGTPALPILWHPSPCCLHNRKAQELSSGLPLGSQDLLTLYRNYLIGNKIYLRKYFTTHCSFIGSACKSTMFSVAWDSGLCRVIGNTQMYLDSYKIVENLTSRVLDNGDFLPEKDTMKRN